MATESPIRLTEANQKWISSKNSANFGQSSSTNMTVEDLGIIFNRKFRGESGNIPINRSESAPPSIEGSFASMEDLMAHKDSPLFGFALSKNSPENFEYDPMNTRILPPINSWENEHLFHLTTHKEEPEDDISSREGIVDQSQPKNPDTLRHENIAMNPSSSLSYESLEEAIDTPSSSSSINNPINTDPRTSLYNRRLSSPNVQLDVNVNESDVSNIEYGIKAMDIYGNMPHQQQQNYVYGPGPGPTPHYVHGPGPTTPLYATATTYMTSPAPLYQNPGYFNPQFITGGYAVNPVLHLPYLGGSSPHGGGFHGGASPSSGPIDTRQLNKFYGQLGFTINDPVNIQYFQDPYGFPSYGGPGSPFSPVPMIPDPKASPLGSSGHGPRRGGPYLGSPTNLGPFTQYQNSPSASPGLTGSRFSPFSQRNTGSYTGWNGPGQGPGLDDSTPLTLIEELKSGKGRRFELSDIAGHIVEFSADQHGSRFIQQKLEKCKPEEKESVFKEIHAHASKLMTDVFGNYVIQKFFEYGTTEQRKELADQLQGQILSLSFQMYGCRVIQKALEVIHLDQKVKLAEELNGHVMKCVRDQNGNHVIQKCIESIPSDKIQFIISSFHGEVAQLSTHPYGCRVIQRVLEHCTDQLQIQLIVDEILESVCDLAQNQYGNYVIQHVLGREKDDERRKIINKLSGRIVQLSQHKFASNVVEKCLEYGDSTSREILIQEIIGHDDGKDNLLVMMKDQYANYVVQKILHMCNESQREMLLSHIKDNQNTLKKFTYGKHIVSRVEQLYEEEN